MTTFQIAVATWEGKRQVMIISKAIQDILEATGTSLRRLIMHLHFMSHKRLRKLLAICQWYNTRVTLTRGRKLSIYVDIALFSAVLGH